MSIPFGPRDVRTASATDLADLMLDIRMSSLRLLSTYDSVFEARAGAGADATAAIVLRDRVGRVDLWICEMWEWK